MRFIIRLKSNKMQPQFSMKSILASNNSINPVITVVNQSILADIRLLSLGLVKMRVKR